VIKSVTRERSLRAEATPIPRSVPQKRGGVLYAIDQVVNPAPVVVKPGGLFEDSCTIAGQVGLTAHGVPLLLVGGGG